MMENLIEIPDDVGANQHRGRSIVGSSPNRPIDDWYPTPPEATLALLEQEKFQGSIWEPACGCGIMTETIKGYGYADVVSTDLIDRGYGETPHDFITSPYLSDNIITNPPYTLAQQFIELSLDRTKYKVAMLVKLQFLEGQKRKAFFANSPLARVYVFSKRVNFYREGKKGKLGTSMIAFSWQVYEHGYKGDPVIKWI